jgi:hypothetical protein
MAAASTARTVLQRQTVARFLGQTVKLLYFYEQWIGGWEEGSSTAVISYSTAGRIS